MDGQRFDELTKRFAFGTSRRRVVKGLAGGVVAGVAALLGRSGTEAQRVTQAYCGNMTCAADPTVCREGCGCCVFGNGNNRCMPPNDCQRLGGTTTVVCTEGEFCNDGSGCPAGCSNGTCVNICTMTGKACIEGQCVTQTGFTQPPSVVWSALTDSKALSSWAMDNDFVPEVGHRFTLRSAPRAGFDGVMEGEVVAVEPGRQLSFTWRGGALETPTTVTLTLEPDGSGTQLRLTHSSPDNSPCLAARQLLGRDWQEAYLRRSLSRHLGRL
ncbi:MAG TPA: SRPBCC domain-containing protein [Thermomicrobiales bacterium]|nr:SRPBCC domain-containing protein [Thermomicrobiales bacterium]